MLAPRLKLGEIGHERASERPLLERSKKGDMIYSVRKGSQSKLQIYWREHLPGHAPRYSNLVCDAVWQAGVCDCELEAGHSPEVQAAETFLWQPTSKIPCPSGTRFLVSSVSTPKYSKKHFQYKTVYEI